MWWWLHTETASYHVYIKIWTYIFINLSHVKVTDFVSVLFGRWCISNESSLFSHCLSNVRCRPSSSICTSCVVRLKEDWVMFCHAGSRQVGRGWSDRKKSPEILRYSRELSPGHEAGRQWNTFLLPLSYHDQFFSIQWPLQNNSIYSFEFSFLEPICYWSEITWTKLYRNIFLFDYCKFRLFKLGEPSHLWVKKLDWSDLAQVSSLTLVYPSPDFFQQKTHNLHLLAARPIPSLTKWFC